MGINKKGNFSKRYSIINNSRGLSTIVITLLLIVLSLAAVGAVWVIVNNIIKDTSNNVNTGEFTLNLRITRVAIQGVNLSVTVQRNPGKGEMTKIKFVVSDGINSEVVVRQGSIEELAANTFDFPLNKINISNVKSVSIAPVFSSSNGQDTTGQVADTFSVSGISNGEYYGNPGNNTSSCTPACTGTDTCTSGVCVPVNCVPESQSATCGAWTCGQKVNNCGQEVSCGGNNCPVNSQCVSGTCTIPSCIPDCTNRQCGIDPICSQSCGVCSGTDTCNAITGICVPVNCVPVSNATTCGTWVCGKKANNCGQEVSCGGNCSTGTLCITGTCTAVHPVNTGLVEEIWPGTSGLYFGSSNLSTTETYEGLYVKFPGSSETRCLLIVVSRLPIAGYTKSHIGFNFVTSISVNNHYQIWSTLQECNA
jgi:hypothetical protein